MISRPFSRLLVATLFASAAVGAQLARPTQALTSDEPAFIQPFGAAGARGGQLVGASLQTGSDDSLARGPYNTATLDYNFGDAFFNKDNPLAGMGPDDPETDFDDERTCELKGRVIYPAGLQGGPFPVVIFMHGMHATTSINGQAELRWPPVQNAIEIASYKGYDYVMDHLASRGFVCVSISANGVNNSLPGPGALKDYGAAARSALIDAHVSLMDAANSEQLLEFGSIFVGKLNPQKLALVGHSRGGEGIVQWYLSRGNARPNVRVAGLMPLCPTNNLKLSPVQTPLGVVLGYADGDVGDLAGAQYYDRSRYTPFQDLAPKHLFTVQGANHNFFNTVWSPSSGQPASMDDWYIDVWNGTGQFLQNRANDEDLGQHAGSQKLDEETQRRIFKAYSVAFMETYLQDDTRWTLAINGGGYFTGFGRDRVGVSYQPGVDIAKRLDVNRLNADSNLTSNIAGGKVTGKDLAQYDLAGGSARRPNIWGYGGDTTSLKPWEPHSSPSRVLTNDYLQGTRLLVASWKTTFGTWVNEISPTYKDVRKYQALQFRAAVDWKNLNNPQNQPVDFSVGLRDTKGVITTQKVSTWSNALNYPHGTRDNDLVPKFITSTVRIPISALVGPDLANIKSIEFLFDERAQGSVVIGELQLVDSQTPFGGKLAINKKIDFSPKKKKKKKTVPIGTTKVMPLVVGNSSETSPMAVRFIAPTDGPFSMWNGTRQITDSSGTLEPGQIITFDVRFTPTTNKVEKGGILVLTSAHDPVLVKLQGQGKAPHYD